MKRILLALAAAPALMGAQTQQNGFEQRMLTLHNSERATKGIGAMEWDDSLAADAKQWANHLAATNSFEHFEEVSDDPDAQGENLWMGTRGAYSQNEMVGGWISEKKDFRPGVFPNVSRTGDLEDVGHYTQIMWRETGRVGCALARNGEWDFLVCRYATSGNVVGERVY